MISLSDEPRLSAHADGIDRRIGPPCLPIDLQAADKGTRPFGIDPFAEPFGLYLELSTAPVDQRNQGLEIHAVVSRLCWLKHVLAQEGQIMILAEIFSQRLEFIPEPPKHGGPYGLEEMDLIAKIFDVFTPFVKMLYARLRESLGKALLAPFGKHV